MNIAYLFGYLAKDPEKKTTKNGHQMTRLVMADNVSKFKVIWWSILLFGAKFDKIIPHLKKGSAIIAIGEMKKPQIYERKDGSQETGMSLFAYELKFPPFSHKEQSKKRLPIANEGNVFSESPTTRTVKEQQLTFF